MITHSGSAQSQTTLVVDVITSGNSATQIGDIDECVVVDVGDTVEVDIGVMSVVGLAAWETTLVFDQSVLEVVASDARMLLITEPGSKVTVQSDLEPPTAFYPTGGFFIGAADGSPNAAESGSGILARVTFRAIAPGVSAASMPQLDLDGNGTTDKGARLLGPGGESDPIGDVNGDNFFDGPVQNGRIAVEAGCTPTTDEPTDPPTPQPATPTATPGAPTATATPTAAGATASPTGSGSPIDATTTPSAQNSVAWGDANCSGQLNPVDSLLTLRHDAGLGIDTGACPAMGTEIDVLNASPHIWGDVDCSGSLSPVDSLKILRFDAGLSVAQEDGCPDMGAQVQIVEA